MLSGLFGKKRTVFENSEIWETLKSMISLKESYLCNGTAV